MNFIAYFEVGSAMFDHLSDMRSVWYTETADKPVRMWLDGLM